MPTAVHYVWSYQVLKHACTGKRGLQTVQDLCIFHFRSLTFHSPVHWTGHVPQPPCLYRHTASLCLECLVLCQGYIWYIGLVLSCSSILPGFTTGCKRDWLSMHQPHVQTHCLTQHSVSIVSKRHGQCAEHPPRWQVPHLKEVLCWAVLTHCPASHPHHTGGSFPVSPRCAVLEDACEICRWFSAEKAPKSIFLH